MSVNKCSFTGVCVKPPKMIRSQSGVDYCLFSLSNTTRTRTIDGRWENRSAIIDFIAFQPKTRYAMKAVHVGSIVAVDAIYAPTEVRGKDGKLKTVPLFKVEEMETMTPKGENEAWVSPEWI